MNKYIAFDNFGKILITTEDNYNSLVLDLNKCCTFNGTLNEANEYIAKYLNK